MGATLPPQLNLEIRRRRLISREGDARRRRLGGEDRFELPYLDEEGADLPTTNGVADRGGEGDGLVWTFSSAKKQKTKK